MCVSKIPSVFGLVIMSTATRSSSRARRSSRSISPSAVLFTGTVSKPAITALAGLVPWAPSGMSTTDLRDAAVAEIGRRHQQGRQLALGPGRRLQRNGRQAGDLGQHLLRLVEQFEHALDRVVALIGMQIGEARHAGDPFVPLGPVERCRHADEAHGFRGRGGVEHDDVVTLLPPVLIDVHHGAEFFHAGQNGQFFRLYTADARGAQHGAYIGGDFLPVALDLSLDIQLLDRKPIVDRHGIGGLNMEEVGVEIESIGQAVCRIDTHHQVRCFRLRQF